MADFTLATRRICEHDCDSTRKEIHLRPHTEVLGSSFNYEAYLEQADALGRERYLKSGAGRRFLQSQLKSYLRKHPSKEAAGEQLYAVHARAEPAGDRSEEPAGLKPVVTRRVRKTISAGR